MRGKTASNCSWLPSSCLPHRAGLGKGTLYRHFAHKGELCRALLNDDLIAFQERLGRLIGNAEVVASPLARLDLLNTERILLMESHLPLFAAIKVAAAGSRPDRPFRGPFSEWMHMRMVELLREAVEQGELAALDLDFTADAILETLSPALYSYHRHMCGYSIERIVAGVRRIFVDGLRQAPSL